MNDQDLINIALRNAMTLKWLGGLSALIARKVEREYSQHAGLPLDEITGCLAYITDQPSLDWVWSRYESEIRVADFLREREDRG
jgi:hypothetical protein